MTEIPFDVLALLTLAFVVGGYAVRNELLQKNNCTEHAGFRTDLDALLDFHKIPRGDKNIKS